MNRYEILAKFPEAKVKHAIQQVSVEAGSFPAAVRRGVEVLLRRDGIARRRLRVIELRVVRVFRTPVDAESPEDGCG
ncbi:MAG: hypothetical protein KatS3mg082_2627 [Nitrospiraceae bacterium]|nr:MAG: hypothetical protein KatS3mg082_2627 [Nitrospiraceae bacterium]